MTLTAGGGGMGGAQPLAVTMNEGVAICVDCDETRHRPAHRAPLPRRQGRRSRRRALALGHRGPRRQAGPVHRRWSATPRRSCPSCCERDAPIDIVTDQTSAHDPLRYLPRRHRLRATWKKTADKDAAVASPSRPASRWPKHVRGDGRASWTRGAEVFDYGNSIRDEAELGRLRPRVRLPRLRARLHPAAVRGGQGPFRWVALSGDPDDIAATDRAVLDAVPRQRALCTRWITDGRRAGRTSRACPRASAGSATASGTCAGLKFNEMVASGELSGADRDRPRPPRLRIGRLALPRDRGDARRLRTPSPTGRCSTRWSTPRPARPGCRSTTAAASAWAAPSTPARYCVADGTELAAQKLERVLTNDPGMGVIRHADAGYEHAGDVAAERGVRIPMQEMNA